MSTAWNAQVAAEARAMTENTFDITAATLGRALARIAELEKAGTALLSSYENYISLRKPKAEWDHYDTGIFPCWAELRALLASPTRGEGEAT